MIEIDIEGFKALSWYYSTTENRITPIMWEKIICKSCDGQWTPGDTFMSDGFVNSCGLNIKSTHIQFNKGTQQRIGIIQCRCPIQNDNLLTNEEFGSKVIETLVQKREKSFETFSLNKMLDVDIIHYHYGDTYSVRLYVSEQPKYENLNLTWKNGHGYEHNSKSWKFRRLPSNRSSFQTCLLIKKVFDVKNALIDFTFRTRNEIEVTIDEAKKQFLMSYVPLC